MRYPITGANLPQRRPGLPARLALALLLASAWPAIGRGEIVDSATALGSYGGRTIASEPAQQVVPVAPAAPAMAVSMTGRLTDEDGRPGAGDTISWKVTVENRGDVTLRGIELSGGLGQFDCGSSRASIIDALAPGATRDCVANYAVTQADIDDNGGGDGDIDSLVTARSAQAGEQTAQASVGISYTPAMRLAKTVAAWSAPFPGIYEIEYLLRAENTGTVRLNDIQLVDDLGAAFGKAAIVGGPWLTLDGFAGDGRTNAGYDGVSDTRLLDGNVRLSPGERGEVTVRVRIDAGPGSVAIENRATGTAGELDAPVISDDPGVTPEVATDDNATALAIVDSDGDGVPDAHESATADRDGDGVADAQDHDPTGYFYCQTNGRIMPGGRITVDNLTAGGSQSGIGSSNGITIVRDGSDGRYQFHVSEAGTYRLRYRLPTGGIASIDRRAGPRLDLSGLAPARAVTLGSGEARSTGVLADWSAPANPFHVEFTIAAGDPAIFDNNIPLRFCGTPHLAADLQVVAGPTLQGDGRSRVTWRVSASNDGDERVDEVRLRDNMAASLGGDFEIMSVALQSAPRHFAATVNPYFDGRGNVELLTSGGNLAPGETVAVELTALVAADKDSYVNRIEAGGVSPLDAGTIAPTSAEARVVPGVGARDLLSSRASASPERVGPGQKLAYAVTFANATARDRTGIELVGQVPDGLKYLPGSASIDGEAIEPGQIGRELVWKDVTVPAGGSRTLRLALAVSATASGKEFTGYAFAREAGNGAVLSDIASAVVRRDPDAVFDCAEIVGQVFDDRNRDGYVQQGEPGIAGVRLAGADGLRVTSDVDGRFDITCPMIPEGRIGTELALEVETDSLPAGYRMTTENTRSVRLNRGKVARLAFGAASLRVVTHILDAGSFESDSTRLQAGSLRALANVLNLLEEEISLLRITYVARAGDELAEQRIEAARRLVTQAWRAKHRPYELTIDTQVVR